MARRKKGKKKSGHGVSDVGGAGMPTVSPGKRRRDDVESMSDDGEGASSMAVGVGGAPVENQAHKRQTNLEGEHQEMAARQAALEEDRYAGEQVGDPSTLVYEGLAEDEIEEDTLVTNEDADMTQGQRPQVWHPSVGMGEGEEMDYDPSAYKSFHAMGLEYPSLSVDFVRDTLGYRRKRYPHTMYVVTGSQAPEANQNKLVCCKISKFSKNGEADDLENDGAFVIPESGNNNNDDDDEDAQRGMNAELEEDQGGDLYVDSDDEDWDGDPILESRYILHQGCVNRLRSLPQKPSVVATISDLAAVQIFDLSMHLRALDEPPPLPLAKDLAPAHMFDGHAVEGYALAWSYVTEGRLLSGDCGGYVYLHEPNESGWATNMIPYAGHAQSVEDITWSPNQANVFATASMDGCIRIYDAREHSHPAITQPAHNADVNVLCWSSLVEFLLASGGDDGEFAVWDLRRFGQAEGQETERFDFHTAPITSIAWHPTEASSLAVASEDNQVSLWDLGVEADAEDLTHQGDADVLVDYPPQLLFIHYHPEVKEIQWHPQIPGVLVSTGQDGLNIFQAMNF